MHQQLANALVNITSIWANVLDEDFSLRAVSFDKDFEYLLKQYDVKPSEFVSHYFDIFKEWDQQTVDTFSVALSRFSNKYSDLLRVETNNLHFE